MSEQLLVVRAGVTDYELDGRLRGTLEVPLAPAGLDEARRMAADLVTAPPTHLYTADDGPSGETGDVVGAALGLKPRVVAGLTNVDQGLWQGMLVEEIRRKQPRLFRQWCDHPWSVVPPEGEALEEACDRIDDVVGRLVRRHPAGRLALVVPWPLDRVVLWVAAGRPLDDVWGGPVSPASVTVVPLAGQWRPARPPVPVG